MSDVVIFEVEVGEDGKIEVQLPPDSPRGRMTVRMELSPVEAQADDVPHPEYVLTPEEEAELIEAAKIAAEGGLGLTMSEILQDPAIGIWADRAEMEDSVDYVHKMRQAKRERRIKRD